MIGIVSEADNANIKNLIHVKTGQEKVKEIKKKILKKDLF